MTRAPQKRPCCEHCSTRACYGSPSEKRPRWCKEHRSTGAVDVNSKICEHPGCTKRATSGTAKTPQWCAEHRPAGAVDVMSKKCKHPGCITRACFGVKTPEWCSKHSPASATNLRSKQCKHPGCTKQPYFGGTKPEWCSEHRPDGATDLISKKCKHPSCTTRACFGVKTPEWCSKHSPASATNLSSKQCKHPGCTKRATFGTDKTPQWCSEHHPTGATNLVSKKCKHPGCTTRAHFGVKTPEWCSKHSPASATNLNSKQCKHPGCTKQPSFGTTKPEYCSEHRPPCAVNLLDKKCEANGCTTSATYNIKGIKGPRWCAEHAAAHGAVDVKSKRCAHEDCDIIINRQRTWCATHDVDAVHQRPQRVRENQVAAFLSNSGFQWSSWNKQLAEPGCGRYRPDWVYDMTTHVVALECDEDQHSAYDQSCERKRMMDIFSSYGGTPVTFLRYNPDRFQIGGATVRRTKQVRLATLARRLQAALTTVPTSILTIEYLFYNGADVATYHVSPDDPSFVLHPVDSE